MKVSFYNQPSLLSAMPGVMHIHIYSCIYKYINKVLEPDPQGGYEYDILRKLGVGAAAIVAHWWSRPSWEARRLECKNAL